MPEIWFYQLQRRRLEQVLPNLIERTLQRGWRAVVQAKTPERLAAIDDLLWTYAEESFLPHGSAAEGDAPLQAVWLTLGADNPNGAQVRFLVEGVEAEPFAEAGYERLILLFDGRDDEILEQARAQWKTLRARDVKLSYWAETEEGGWRQQK
ncbi:DNA polymerase III subunit chi [uncultured Rhodoblastus sp.]|uniref:DNA polymerase III subunit chi n=1 Tax=uncultured Rhodoblastus sp. TaxID=543037 RepID=UPI0025D30285|nr:DNA polymerase III subunit chi [uncultured Rhodoblastus sp.]